MTVRRILKHLATPPWLASRRFGEKLVEELGAAIELAEAGQRGELRLVVEGPMPWHCLRRGMTARERARALFAQLGVWDTALNSGILIYVQLVDRQVEIVADRGISARVEQAEWDTLCRLMEQAFRAGQYREGALAAIHRAGALLVRHFPESGDNPDELPNRPLIL